MSDAAPASARLGTVLDELRSLAHAVRQDELTELLEALLSARRVFFSGMGRSGLMARAFAIRLLHIGLDVHVAGEPSTPAIETGDLLVAVSGSGRTATTLSHMRTATAVGATVFLVTAVRDETPGMRRLVLPARTDVATVQHAGSLFEQGVLVVGDVVAAAVQQRLDVPEAELHRRHANLE